MKDKNTSGLYIYSGECNMGRVGDPVGHSDASGMPLHVGDIVQLWEGHYIDTDLEEWYPSGGITAIVCDQFISYQDGTMKLKDGPPELYCMGIKSSGFDSPQWRIFIVKSHRDVIDSERWPRFGFNYRKSTQADALLSPARTENKS